MDNRERRLLERLIEVMDRPDFRSTIDAYALEARARLASDPVAALSWAALPARALPRDLPEGVGSAWVFVVRRGRNAGCHMHPNSVQASISHEGSGTLLVGPPGSAQPHPLGDDRTAPVERRACAIRPGVYHDAVAGDRDWVVVSFHSVPAQALSEIGYGATEGTSAGFAHGATGARAASTTGIRIDPRCRRETTPYPRVPAPHEFGRVFTANMFRMRYTPERGWHEREVVPLEPIALHPATSALHYGQEIFEGLKAYRLEDGAVAIFRPDAHARRLRASAERMAMPPVDPDDFVAAVTALVSLDQGRLPADPQASLYIRPLCLATDIGLGVQASREYLFLVFACVVGRYHGTDARPMRVLALRDYVRAVRGGTGAAKAAGNYGGSLVGQRIAKERGFDQILWLDALHLRDIEELGAMNFFAVYGRELVTPPLSGTILPGVTRDTILKLAPSLGFTATERPLALDEVLEDARAGRLTEAFAAGTAAVITPVGEIADGDRSVQVGGGEAGEVSRTLLRALADLRAGRAPDPHGWLVRV